MSNICRNCKKEYTDSNAKGFPEWYCSDMCEKIAEEKNYDAQVKYSTQGQRRAAFESDPFRGR